MAMQWGDIYPVMYHTDVLSQSQLTNHQRIRDLQLTPPYSDLWPHPITSFTQYNCSSHDITRKPAAMPRSMSCNAPSVLAPPVNTGTTHVAALVPKIAAKHCSQQKIYIQHTTIQYNYVDTFH
jgi:hypothetical protein